MRLQIGTGLYSQFDQPSRACGHEVTVADPIDFQVVISRGRPAMFHGDRLLLPVDLVVPRIGASITNYGAAACAAERSSSRASLDPRNTSRHARPRRRRKRGSDGVVLVARSQHGAYRRARTPQARTRPGRASIHARSCLHPRPVVPPSTPGRASIHARSCLHPRPVVPPSTPGRASIHARSCLHPRPVVPPSTPTFPDASGMLITADGGGSNGSRLRLWKVELQTFVRPLWPAPAFRRSSSVPGLDISDRRWSAYPQRNIATSAENEAPSGMSSPHSLTSEAIGAARVDLSPLRWMPSVGGLDSDLALARVRALGQNVEIFRDRS